MTYCNPYNELASQLCESWEAQFRLNQAIERSFINRFPNFQGFLLAVSALWSILFLLNYRHGVAFAPPLSNIQLHDLSLTISLSLGAPAAFNFTIYALNFRPKGVLAFLLEVSTFILASSWSFLATFLLLSLPLSVTAGVITAVAVLAWAAFLNTNNYRVV